MEHRWGQRIQADMAVRIELGDGTLRLARLVDLSLSGALLKVGATLKTRGPLQVRLCLANGQRSEPVEALLVRQGSGMAGVEWCDFAPEVIMGLMRERQPVEPQSALEVTATYAVARQG